METKRSKLLDGYLTEPELAAELGVTPRTIKRWRALRMGPPVTFVGNGKSPRFNLESVRLWLRDREIKMARAPRARSRAADRASTAQSI